jgi:hypothetical protein
MEQDGGRGSYRFEGFEAPHYTQIPDAFFDEVMCHLSEAELRVALYIMRRTFGFKKRADAISFNQFLKGIVTRDGRRLDHGCGIAGRTNLTRALRGLEEKGVISARRSTSARGDAQTTVYELRFKESGGVAPRDAVAPDGAVTRRDHASGRVVPEGDHPGGGVVTEADHGGDRRSPPVVIGRDPQDPDRQETGNNSTETSSEDDATALCAAIDAASEALGDGSPRGANRARAARLLAGVSDEYAAQIAEQALGRVAGILRAKGGVKSPMAYYFRVLEDMAGQARPGGGRRDGLAGRYGHLVQR